MSVSLASGRRRRCARKATTATDDAVDKCLNNNVIENDKPANDIPEPAKDILLTENADEESESKGTTRLERFIREMRVPEVRSTYISTVDAHVTNLINSAKVKEKKRKGKISQANQIAECKDKIDISNADSILAHANIRTLLNHSTFSSLPLFYQYKLVKMLPDCDQTTTAQGWVKPSPTALTNEFFTKAAKDWSERLRDGKLTQESVNRRQAEADRERAKLDPWKAKHFEPLWGQCLESHKVTKSELDRIPRVRKSLRVTRSSKAVCEATSIAPVEPSSTPLATKELEPESESPIAYPIFTIDHSPRDIVEQPLISSVTQSKDTPEISVEEVSIEQPSCSSPVPLSTTVTEIPSEVTLQDATSKTESEQSVSQKNVRVVRIETTSVISCVSQVSPVTSRTLLPASTSMITPSMSITITTSEGQPSAIKTRSGRLANRSPEDARANKAANRKRANQKLVNGVDAHRSSLICQKAVAESANNKLFYVSNYGKIHQVNPTSGETLLVETIAAALAASPRASSADDDHSNRPDPEGPTTRAALVELPVPLPQGIELKPASSLTQNHVQDKLTKMDIVIDTNTGTVLKSPKQSPFRNILSKAINVDDHSLDHNELKDDSNSENKSGGLPYKLPQGITITPAYPALAANQVPVITKSESQVIHHTGQQPSSSQVWLVPNSGAIFTGNQFGQLTVVDHGHHMPSEIVSQQVMGYHESPNHGTLGQVQVNYCGELTRLPVANHCNTTWTQL
ncbi:Polycomb protein Asx [Halotydeus destructor]|nr:Polycomb protein Asx [Halotydeus destructor]